MGTEGRLLAKIAWPFEFIAALIVGVPLGLVVGVLMTVVVWAAAAAMIFSAARETLRRRSGKKNTPPQTAAPLPGQPKAPGTIETPASGPWTN